MWKKLLTTCGKVWYVTTMARKPSEKTNPPKEGQNPFNGQFLPGHKLAPGGARPGTGPKPIRVSGRHWVRRALEIPEADWPKTEFCAADRFARKLVKELDTLSGKDFVSAISTVHSDAYGQEQRLEIANAIPADQVGEELDRINAEIERLLKGGK